MTKQREQELIVKGEIKALETFIESKGLSHTKTYKKAVEELKTLKEKQTKQIVMNDDKERIIGLIEAVIKGKKIFLATGVVDSVILEAEIGVEVLEELLVTIDECIND